VGIEQIERKRRTIENKKVEMNQLLSQMQKGINNGNLKCRVKEQALAIMNEIRDAEEFIEEQSRKISSLPDEKMQDILMMRYFENMTWENIASSLGITYVWCMKLSKRALKALERM
jgi:DNA-directed RNA polymerase specialized sigma subunit